MKSLSICVTNKETESIICKTSQESSDDFTGELHKMMKEHQPFMRSPKKIDEERLPSFYESSITLPKWDKAIIREGGGGTQKSTIDQYPLQIQIPKSSTKYLQIK